MNKKQIVLLYLKYTLMVGVVIGLFASLQLGFIVKQIKPQYIVLPIILTLVLGAFVGTIMMFKQLHHEEHVVRIYLKYTSISILIVGTFFTLQFTLVVKEFQPHYAALPVVLGLVIGFLLSTVVMFRQRLYHNNLMLHQANAEIAKLNGLLHEENRRLGTELDVARQLQEMVLPSDEEVANLAELDIAAFMEPAEEVGGDYYDVLRYGPRISIGIGDVTGHGLESGVMMLMVQTAVRTLLAAQVENPKAQIDILNRVIYDNAQRMGSDKNLTLALMDYSEGKLRFSGQHESLLLVRANGKVEEVDTTDLGFMVGLKDDISDLLVQREFDLRPGDGLVLYTDGIVEAFDREQRQYGVERLCRCIAGNWAGSSSQDVLEALLGDFYRHIGDCPRYDDLTLLVAKRR